MTRSISALALTTLLFAGTPATAAPSDSEITDAEVCAALESDLFAAKGVSGHDVDVAVSGGIVTLSGNVDSILSKERAVRIASMLKGVRSVVDRTTVDVTVPDEQIALNVKAALLDDPATSSWEIGVAVDDAVVTLTGAVDSIAERTLAATVAKDVRGVRDLKNDLAIDSAAFRTDEEIEHEIERVLAWDARLQGALIDVEVREGNVLLSGVVGSAHERVMARTAAWVAGVTTVDTDELSVRWWARDDMRVADRSHDVSDGEIHQAVMDAFLRDPRVLAFNPEVTVFNGIVTLRGTVDNVKARRAAAADAANTAGVTRVNNLLKVATSAGLSDDVIADCIVKALARDVVVYSEDIDVSVDNGVASLTGDVSSYFAREQAEDVVTRVPGVLEIDNRLSVSYDLPAYVYAFHDWDPRRYDYDFDYATLRRRPDWEIKADIESELWWSPFVDEDQITVRVEDGTATLTGTVDTWRERLTASENAIEGGAVSVINQLSVDYRSDET